jgi:RHS repeat-associated protein
MAVTNRTIFIGSEIDGKRSFWKGFLDELRIYNRALTAAEIAELGGRSTSTIATLTPTAARLDVLQAFTLTGTGLSASTTYAIENCTPEAANPVVSPTAITFRCTPTLPGNKALSVNGTPVSGITVNIDHPARLGNAAARGIPSVNGVSLWNGNVHLEATDLAVPGKGVSFALTRSYNSYSWDYEAARGGVSAAAPWRFNWDLQLGYVAGTANNQLWVQREDGSGENFFKDAGVWYPMDQGNFNTLKGDTPIAGQTTLLTREGLQYIFQNPDQGGLLIKILDHDGNGLTITRDGSHRVGTVSDASGRIYTFTYDANGRLYRVSDFTHRYVEYSWESGASSVRLKTVRDVRGQVTTYNYALYTSTLAQDQNPPPAQYLLTGIVDPRLNTARTFTYTDKVYGNWGAASVKDALNTPWSFVYCAVQTSATSCSSGSTQVDPTGALSFQTTTTPPLGAATIARFDTGGRVTEQVDANRNTAKTTPMPMAGLTSKTYPLAALPTKKQSALGAEPANNYGTDYVYTPDNAGNLFTQKDAENATTTRTWLNDAGLLAKNLQRVSKFATATGAEHNFTHTATGNVERYTPPALPAGGLAIALAYDAAGQVTGVTDSRGNASAREYDVHGNLKKVTEPGVPTRFVQNTYDDLGRILTTIDKRGGVTTHSWDEAGHLLSVYDALNGRTSYLYDANGNRTQMKDALNNITRYTYDANNRQKTVERIIGAQTLTTTTNYDVLGRVTSTVNANSHADSITYDGEGNVLIRANALAFTTTYVYDADNRVTQTTDPEGRVTDTTYDKVGRVKTVKTAAGTTGYDYDADGRLTASTDPRGKKTQYAYDAAGRLTTLTDANSQITRATYDANGNLLSVLDPNGHTTTYTYDTANRPLTRIDANGQQWVTVYDENGNVKTSTVPGNKTTTTTYDLLNRVTRVDYPDASFVTTTYDANGNRLTMTDSTGTTSYLYDALDRLSSKTDPLGKTVSYSYDGIGNVATLGYPGGQSVSYLYDAGERLTSLTDWLGKTTTYTLNKAGQVTAALFGNNSRADLVYDAAGRLTSLIDKKADASVISSHVMTLDANGNIINAVTQLPLEPSIPAGNRSLSYDNANRLATYNGAAVTHDAAGRITSLSGATYSYNDRDQIAAITGAQTAAYAYNGEGHRVLRNVGGQVTRFVIDANRGLPEVLAETDNGGTVQRRYVYGYGLVEQIDSANAASYYHFDPTGSTLALTNAAGAVSDSYAYTPYGETTVSGATVNPFRYVGKLGVMDDGNGLQYMRARYYRPEVARFMSLDRLAGEVGSPQSLNRYAYVVGNPVMGVDASGLVTMSTAERRESIRNKKRMAEQIKRVKDAASLQVSDIWPIIEPLLKQN